MPLSTVLGAQSLIKPGVCTTATRPASPYTGQMIYDTTTLTTLVWNGTAWANVGATTGGLVLISTTTIGTAVSSVTVSGAFSSTYDNYQIVIAGGAGSAGLNLELTFGATATGYYSQLIYQTYNNSPAGSAGVSNGSKFTYAGTAYSGGIAMSCYVGSPNLAKTTVVGAAFMGDGFGGNFNGTLQNSTQYTAFTVTASAGTLTGGTIYVYGFAKA